MINRLLGALKDEKVKIDLEITEAEARVAAQRQLEDEVSHTLVVQFCV